MANQSNLHPKIQALQSAREADKRALFKSDRNEPGAKVPLYEPQEQQRQIAQVEKRFQKALDELAQTAERDLKTVEITLSRLDNEYDWLNSAEIAHAAAMAPFLKEDIDRADSADQLLGVIRKAQATNSKPHKWLVYRLAPARYQQLTTEGKIGNPADPDTQVKREQVFLALVSLRNGTSPASWKELYATTVKKRDEAREIIDGVHVLKMVGAA